MPTVFISYSSKDQELATDLAANLRPFGETVFMSYDSIDAGEDDWEVIMKRLRSADWVLLAATPNACRSKGVLREMEEAHRLGKPVIPLMRGITPEALKKKLGHLVKVKQGVPVDDPVKFQKFLNQFGAKVGKGNTLVGVVIGVVVTLLIMAVISGNKRSGK